MHRFLLLTGVCLWLISLVGCGGDDATPVASNDGASSEEHNAEESSYEDEDAGGSEDASGGSGARSSEDSSGGSGARGSSDEEEMEAENAAEYGGGSSTRDGSGSRSSYDEEDEAYRDAEMEAENAAEYGGGSSTRGGYGEEDSYSEEEMESGYGGGQPGAERPQRPMTLAEKSQAAFADGRESEAFQYLFAHAATADDEGAKALLDKMGLLAAAKRPAMAVRWGVGIDYTAPKDYEGNAYPIGVDQPNVQTGRSGGGGYGGTPSGMRSPPGAYADAGEGEGEGYGSGSGMSPGGGGGARGAATTPQLKQLTGELGETFVAGLQERVGKGSFGKVLAEATSGGPRRPVPGGPGGYGSGYGEDEDGSGYGQPERQPRDQDPEGPVQMLPGIVFLGVADAKDLKTKAKEANVDVLCVFEVEVKFNVRQRTIVNETTIAVYNLLDDKRPDHETKKMNNIQVQVARAGNDKDVVEEEMKELFEYIDSTWLMADMPALTEDAVLARLRPLITEPQETPLPILAEIRMYRTRGLLTQGNYAIACKALLGEQLATTLATGTDEEKMQAVAKWLPKEG